MFFVMFCYFDLSQTELHNDKNNLADVVNCFGLKSIVYIFIYGNIVYILMCAERLRFTFICASLYFEQIRNINGQRYN